MKVAAILTALFTQGQDLPSGYAMSAGGDYVVMSNGRTHGLRRQNMNMVKLDLFGVSSGK